jgi:PilZ domain
MLENRNNERHLTLRTGKIILANEPDHIDCAVLNISRSGACILVPAGAAVSDFFELAIDCEEAPRNCRRVWQDGCRIGVAFSDGEQVPRMSV